jgi:transposase
MEATGVYGEALAYFVYAQGYLIAVEPPLEVKRAFKPYGPKTDPVDRSPSTPVAIGTSCIFGSRAARSWSRSRCS